MIYHTPTPKECAPSLHRSLLDLILNNVISMREYVHSMPIPQKDDHQGTSSLALVPYNPNVRYQDKFITFLTIVVGAALYEYYQDPDPPELIEIEKEERIDQLELENDSLYVALEETEWEFCRFKKQHRSLKSKYHMLQNSYNEQNESLLHLGTLYSDLNIELAATQADSDDIKIAYQQQVETFTSMISDITESRDDYVDKLKRSRRENEKLLKKIDSYDVTLAAKDLKLFAIVEERDILQQRLKKQAYALEQSNNYQSITMPTNAITTTTTTVAAATSTQNATNTTEITRAPLTETTTATATTTNSNRPQRAIPEKIAMAHQFVRGLNRIRRVGTVST